MPNRFLSQLFAICFSRIFLFLPVLATRYSFLNYLLGYMAVLSAYMCVYLLLFVNVDVTRYRRQSWIRKREALDKRFFFFLPITKREKTARREKERGIERKSATTKEILYSGKSFAAICDYYNGSCFILVPRCLFACGVCIPCVCAAKKTGKQKKSHFVFTFAQK